MDRYSRVVRRRPQPAKSGISSLVELRFSLDNAEPTQEGINLKAGHDNDQRGRRFIESEYDVGCLLGQARGFTTRVNFTGF